MVSQKEHFDDEFSLTKVSWDDETKLVSINEFVEPSRIFNVDIPTTHLTRFR